MLELPELPVPTPAGISVFREILQHGPIARAQIARNAGLSQPAVTKATNALMAEHFVTEAPEEASTSPITSSDRGSIGRPMQPLVVNSRKFGMMGVKVISDRLYAVVVDLLGNVLSKESVAVEGKSPQKVIDSTAEIFDELYSATSLPLVGIGIGISGDIDGKRGVVRRSPILGWNDPVNLRELLEERCGLPVSVRNDVGALTVAEEIFGVGTKSRSFAIVTIGAGIGCGLYINGNLVHGAYDVAGEIGHLPLAPGNLLCTCGKRGCVETVASFSSILKSIRKNSGMPTLSFDDAVTMAKAGDPQARAAFALAGETIGKAVASVVNLVGPEQIIISGEGVENYDLFAHQVRESFAGHVFGAAQDTKISLRSHTFYDWARGAAVSVILDILRV